MDVTSVLLYCLTCSCVAGFMAQRRGLSVRSWVLLGALLGLIALIILLFEPSSERDASDPV